MEKREWSDLFTVDLAVADPEIARLIADQERLNRATVNLVASLLLDDEFTGVGRPALQLLRLGADADALLEILVRPE